MLHGFSASPDEFRGLKARLKESGIPYISKRLSGFGLSTPVSLKEVSYTDWLNDAEESFKKLYAICPKVDIVAHSMGSLLGLWLLKHKQIGTVIFTAPYLLPKVNHRKYVALLHSNTIFSIFKLFRPVVTKSTPEESPKRLVYHTVPVEAIAELWKLSGLFEATEFPRHSIVVCLGALDKTIEDEELRKILSKKGIDAEYIVYRKSGHNLLEDVESEIVINDIIGILENR